MLLKSIYLSFFFCRKFLPVTTFLHVSFSSSFLAFLATLPPALTPTFSATLTPALTPTFSATLTPAFVNNFLPISFKSYTAKGSISIAFLISIKAELNAVGSIENPSTLVPFLVVITMAPELAWLP